MCLPVSGALPASKTHTRGRRWTFIAGTDATSPALGTLIIVQSKADTESYGVAVEDGQVLFVKQSDGEVCRSRRCRTTSASCGTPGCCRLRSGDQWMDYDFADGVRTGDRLALPKGSGIDLGGRPRRRGKEE